MVSYFKFKIFLNLKYSKRYLYIFLFLTLLLDQISFLLDQISFVHPIWVQFLHGETLKLLFKALLIELNCNITFFFLNHMFKKWINPKIIVIPQFLT